jgi:hypothetical protein
MKLLQSIGNIVTGMFYLFAGWGEHIGTQGKLCAGEDMYGSPCKSGVFRDSAHKVFI